MFHVKHSFRIPSIMKKIVSRETILKVCCINLSQKTPKSAVKRGFWTLNIYKKTKNLSLKYRLTTNYFISYNMYDFKLYGGLK